MILKDLLTYIPILIFVVVLFKLSDREIKKTLRKTREGERLLLKEKEQLERQINEETKKLRENRFERMNELSRAAEFGKLAQGLFHDLMTPLSSIILHTEKLGQIKKEDLKIINNTLRKTADASHKMAQYIENVKSSIRDNQIKKECDIRQEIEDVIDLLKYKIKNANISIHIDSKNKYILYGDPIKIKQIFLNLISNSIDSYDYVADRRNKDIFIDINKIEDKIIIKVKDNGCGIKEENLERVFEPFFSTKTKEKGIGIGLTTIKKIIEDDFFGQIKVFSEKNNGTCMILEMPYAIYKS